METINDNPNDTIELDYLNIYKKINIYLDEKNIQSLRYSNLILFGINNDESFYKFFENGYTYSFTSIVLDIYIFLNKNIIIDDRLIDIIIGVLRYPINYKYILKRINKNNTLFEENINNRTFLKNIIKKSNNKLKIQHKYIEILINQFIKSTKKLIKKS